MLYIFLAVYGFCSLIAGNFTVAAICFGSLFIGSEIGDIYDILKKKLNK